MPFPFYRAHPDFKKNCSGWTEGKPNEIGGEGGAARKSSPTPATSSPKRVHARWTMFQC